MTNNEFLIANASSYTHEYSQFPYNLITQHNFKDADNSITSLINEINGYKEKGDFESASKLSAENSELLKQYVMDATVPNTMEEEIKNVQTMALQKHQCVYFCDNEPEVCAVGDVWEGGL